MSNKPTSTTTNEPIRVINGPSLSISQNSVDRAKNENRIISGNRNK